MGLLSIEVEACSSFYRWQYICYSRCPPSIQQHIVLSFSRLLSFLRLSSSLIKILYLGQITINFLICSAEIFTQTCHIKYEEDKVSPDSPSLPALSSSAPPESPSPSASIAPPTSCLHPPGIPASLLPVSVRSQRPWCCSPYSRLWCTQKQKQTSSCHKWGEEKELQGDSAGSDPAVRHLILLCAQDGVKAPKMF